MRLDLLLKTTGIIKRRMIAKKLAETGHIDINDKVAKPSSEVKNEDVLTLRLGERVLKVIINIENNGKKDIVTFKQI